MLTSVSHRQIRNRRTGRIPEPTVRSAVHTRHMIVEGILMHCLKKILSTAGIAVLIGAGAVVASGGAASARTVCNSDGECWHESTQYEYPVTLGFRFYGDDYRTTHREYERINESDHARDHYIWRADHEGRGYYRDGVWITF